MKSFSFIPSLAVFLVVFSIGFVAGPLQVLAGPVPVRYERAPADGPTRDFKENILQFVCEVHFNNGKAGDRTGVIIRNSEVKDDEGNPVKSWSIIMNNEVFAETIEVKREKSSIFLKQKDSTEEYQIDLKTGKILNRNQQRKDWAQILVATLALVD